MDAVRILDFGHAVGHLTLAAEGTFGAKTAASQAWVDAPAHQLKEGEPVWVLAALAELPVEEARDRAAAVASRAATLGYLATRWDQIHYADFRAQGWPIGSGMVESANQPVVEGRLKGPGMHWAPTHVDPMVALRTALANDRWDEAWGELTAHRRQQRRAAATARRARRRPVPDAPPPIPPATVDPLALEDTREVRSPATLPAACPKLVVNGRPTAAHPWKRAICRSPTRAPHPSLPKL